MSGACNVPKRRKTAISSSRGDEDVDLSGTELATAALSPKEPATTAAASAGRSDSMLVISTPADGLAGSAPPIATGQGSSEQATIADSSIRVYDARFAHPAVCVCAENHTVQTAMEQLVGAVRNTAATLTLLHSKEPLPPQCALLAKMFEFDGFLW